MLLSGAYLLQHQRSRYNKLFIISVEIVELHMLRIYSIDLWLHEETSDACNTVHFTERAGMDLKVRECFKVGIGPGFSIPM